MTFRRGARAQPRPGQERRAGRPDEYVQYAAIEREMDLRVGVHGDGPWLGQSC